jgi:head-tail adaptor
MNYNREFIWLQRSVSKSGTTGQDQETFTGNGTLWGSSKPISASKKLAYGVLNSEVDYEIHLRQFPSVDAKDRLHDTYFDKLLVVVGVMPNHDTNETVIYAHTLPSLET